MTKNGLSKQTLRKSRRTTAKKMGSVWLEPKLVGQFEYVEWTPDGHLRHSKFIGLRDDTLGVSRRLPLVGDQSWC